MNEDQAEALIDALDDIGVDDAEIYENYSGRGMFGRTTTGIVLDYPDLSALGYAAAKAGLEFDEIPQRSDNLGHRTIVY